jgi:MFS family permease
VNAIIGFSDQILLDAGLPDADLAAVLVAGFQAFATFLAVLLMDRAGRRLLLFVSCAGMAASASLLAFSFLFRQSLGTFRGLLATLGTAVFVISYALGLGAIPWIIQGEIFSSRAKGIGSSVAVFVNWGMAAVITGTYESGEAMIHDYGMFFLYAGFLVLGVVFTAMFVPETKGKSLEQIQHSLSRSIVA